jgi:AcrR family transcriptional regulator
VRQITGVDANTGMHRDRIAADDPAVSELLREPSAFGSAKKEIDFRERFSQLVLVTLDHAADANYRLTSTVRLVARCFDHRIDRFLLRRVDEAARIDDDDVRFIEVAGIFAAVLGELREIALGVDCVLVAAECDEADFEERCTS